MGIEKEIERYHTHLISDEVSTLDPVSDNFGSKFGSHPFYEGRIRFYKQEVLFVLHKQIPDRDTFDEVRDMCEELQTARIRHAAVQYNQKSRHDQRWLVSSAEETYEKYLIPEEDWSHGESAVSTAMQILFSTHAKIVIPGFIGDTFVDNNDNILSQYKPIPSKRRSELIGTLRDMGYDGPVEFWK